jgi:hypothetical protein
VNKFDATWRKLVTAARGVPPAGDGSAPFGFSTRVAALAFAGGRPPASAFARLSLRAAAVACLLAIVAVAVNFSAITGAFEDESAFAAGDDPIAEVVNAGS